MLYVRSWVTHLKIGYCEGGNIKALACMSLLCNSNIMVVYNKLHVEIRSKMALGYS